MNECIIKENTSLRDEFISIAKANIKREGLDKLLEYLDTTDFYIAPASTKYHGSYQSGLVEHSLNVYYSLIDELHFIYGAEWEKKYSKESATIVSLFHDLCKIYRYKKSYRNVKNPETQIWEQVPIYLLNEEHVPMGHGANSVITVMNYMRLTKDEQGAIYWHMGACDISQYSTMNDLTNQWNKNTLGLALYRADLLSTFVIENKFFEAIPIE